MIAGISCSPAYQISLSTVHQLTCQCCVMAFPGDLKVMQQRNPTMAIEECLYHIQQLHLYQVLEIGLHSTWPR
ncbi:MAG: hypothetical protein EZS28_047704, partial [Streblomastix strix]